MVKPFHITCAHCGATSKMHSSNDIRYCPACGKEFREEESFHQDKTTFSETESITLIHGHEPKSEGVQFEIGPYQVIRNIGKGGMGEVLLAYDTVCGRRIALKRIREDLTSFPQIQNRFLKEARVTSQLMHPAIIPIYSIQKEQNTAYYTMPFVEGETLKQILKRAREQEKSHLGKEALNSIPSLLRIFLAVCQAIAYSHSKSVLHRDIKPENIIVGTYGQVLILDWGLAKVMRHEEKEEEGLELKEKNSLRNITMLGKVVGTLGYMAPERALGKPATKETDIYSLGVILYQILTLKLPFKRKTLKQFRDNLAKEVLHDPIEVAPYRDIPKVLSKITLKCLSTNLEERYKSVDQLIHDLENYIEGRAEWFEAGELNIHRKEDWEFQEHILIAEHTAITRGIERSFWATLMVSKASFSENLKLEADVFLEENAEGIGFLFNIPETLEREEVNDGYCLWLSSDQLKSTRLLCSSIELLSYPEISLSPGFWHHIEIEKVDSTIRLTVNGIEQFTYITRMPLVGTHVGLLCRDTHFKLQNFKVFVGSQNIMVNCLSVPDAFLANKDYKVALAEYRRIGYAFSGRQEGREAILRAGITLIEEGKATGDEALFDLAQEEFEKLHHTAGAPLEYLGKALIYETLQEVEEEVKCFELAFRRYPKHPLLHTLHEQVLFRLMKSTKSDRKAVYHFLLLALYYIPNTLELASVQRLIEDLKAHTEPLPFIQPIPSSLKFEMLLTLAFSLHKTEVLKEIAHDHLLSAVFALCRLGEIEAAREVVSHHPKTSLGKDDSLVFSLVDENIDEAFHLLNHKPTTLSLEVMLFLMDQAIDSGRADLVYQQEELLSLSKDERLISKKLFALLLELKIAEASALVQSLPLHLFTEESTLLHFLYGCLLYVQEGSEIAKIHWGSLLDTPYPHTWNLGSYYLTGRLDPSWFRKAFDFEKRELKRQLELFEKLKLSQASL